jgi:hypothetical protein
MGPKTKMTKQTLKAEAEKIEIFKDPKYAKISNYAKDQKFSFPCDIIRFIDFQRDIIINDYCQKKQR